MVVGRFLIDRVLRLIARAKVREAMTAAALLTVVGVSLVMMKAGLSPSLGAFLAGALLAESSYRHQLEADIQPFEGLLLGMFFTAVGMTLNLEIVVLDPGLIAVLVVWLVAIKVAVLYGLGIWHGLEPWAARRLGSVDQPGRRVRVRAAGGGRRRRRHDDRHVSEPLEVAVTLSMALTPLLLMLDDTFTRRCRGVARLRRRRRRRKATSSSPGFGRFGQITARILRGKHIPFTALDINPEQIALVERFGSKAFYGDASRLEILEAAQAGKARALVLAIDDVEASLTTARRRARAFSRVADLRPRPQPQPRAPADGPRREGDPPRDVPAAFDLTRELLRGLGMPEPEVRFDRRDVRAPRRAAA